MIYLIGLGLNEKGISLEGLLAIKKCKKIYLESYTVDFPYSIAKLEKVIGKKIVKLDREKVENNGIVLEAKKTNICLLVYGSPLFATTHISLIMDAEKQNVELKIIYSSSVFDAIASCGLQLYKFGKVTSLTKWGKNFEPDSFLDIVYQNKSIGAHSLILIDIGLGLVDALNELETSIQRKKMNMDKLVVCSNLGTDKSKIYYGTIGELKSKKIIAPYCFIIPGEMHFLETEALERFEI
jgi:diphthine synthase